MRFFATCFVMLAATTATVSANENVKRSSRFDVITEVHRSALPPARYSRSLSVDENNQRLQDRAPEQYLLVRVDAAKLPLQLRSAVGSAVNLHTDQGDFAGVVFGLQKIHPRDGNENSLPKTQFFVRVQNQRDLDGSWRLRGGESGRLTLAARAAETLPKVRGAGSQQ